MRFSLLIAISLPTSGCLAVQPETVAAPITSHAVSAADYPPESLQAGEQGTAALRFVVIDDGTVGDVQVVRSSGSLRLDRAAVAMVKSRWRYQPATTNGRPVRSAQTANVAFVLGTAWSYPIAFDTTAEASRAEVDLGPQARARIEPVYAAYRDVERRHSAWPAARDDMDRLLLMGEIDRAGRTAYATVDLSPLEATERAAAFAAVRNEIARHDLANQAALKAMLPPEGWFLKSRYGQGAVQAAFDIVYHAVNDAELQSSVLAAMEPLVARGEIRAQAYAMLHDRLANKTGRPQRYGSEMICRDRRWVPAPLESAEQVNLWRATIGFSATMEEYVAGFVNSPPCS